MNKKRQQHSQELLDALESAGNEYRRLTESVLKKANVLAEAWIKLVLLPGVRVIRIKPENPGTGLTFSVREIRSNVGAWDAVVCEREGLDEFGFPESLFRVLPGKIHEIGSWDHLHGDYNTRIDYMARGEVLAFVKDYPRIVKETEKVISKINNDLTEVEAL
jgi:hypothetical protein